MNKEKMLNKLYGLITDHVDEARDSCYGEVDPDKLEDDIRSIMAMVSEPKRVHMDKLPEREGSPTGEELYKMESLAELSRLVKKYPIEAKDFVVEPIDKKDKAHAEKAKALLNLLFENAKPTTAIHAEFMFQLDDQLTPKKTCWVCGHELEG